MYEENLSLMYQVLCRYAFVPEGEWYKLKSKVKSLAISKNDYFLKLGEKPDKMALIVKGLFRVFYISEKGAEVTIVFRGEETFLSGYSAFLENTTAQYYIQALEEGLLFYVSLEDYMALSREHECWQTITVRYGQKLLIEKEKRERALLSDDAKMRYEKFVAEFPELVGRAPKRYIASYLGMTPETLSRIIRQN